MTVGPAKPDVRPLPKKKHWLRRIVLAFFLMLAAMVLTVQVVLWTDLPRGIVVAQIEKQLRLRLTVKSLSTSWLGNTELDDVTIGLPLAGKAFLEVPAMKVKNTTLFGLMLGRPVEVEAIELNRPHLFVRQGADGTWNLQELAELLGRTGGSSTGQASAGSSSAPAMPNVRIVGGIISISDNKNRTAEIEPVSVTGYRDTGVSWRYDVQIPSRLSMTGQLVPGGNWEHEVTVKVQDVSPWARPWAEEAAQLSIDATWHGSLSDTGFDGRLEVKKVTASAGSTTANVSGALSIGMAGGLVTARPENLLLDLPGSTVSRLKLASGSISYNPVSNDLKVDQLLVALFGGDARVSAQYNVNANTGRIAAEWEKLALPGGISHSGSFNANLRQPFPDQIKVDAHLDSRGSQAASTWTAAVAFDLTGKSFADFDWNVNVEKLLWQRHDQRLQLDGLSMTGGLHDNALALRSMGLPNRELITASASYHLTGAKPWQVHLQAQRLPFYSMRGTELAFDLAMHGDDNGVFLEKSVLKTSDLELTAKASYILKSPTQPLNIELWINNSSSRAVPVAAATFPQTRLIHGTVEGHFKLGGTLEPLRLGASGHLDGHEIDFLGYYLGEVALELSKESHVDDDGAFFYTDQLLLFGGHWGIDGVYVFDSDEVKVNIDFGDVSLQRLAAVSGRDDLSGTAQGNITMIHPWFAPDLNHLTIPQTTITLRNVKTHDVAIDQITAAVSLDKGILQVNPSLALGKGTGDLKISTNVNDFHRIDLAAVIKNWPIDMPGADAHMDVSVSVPRAIIRLPNPQSPVFASRRLSIVAPLIQIDSKALVKREKLAELTAFLGIDGRVLDLRGLHLTTLGGRLDGQAYADLDHLLATTAEFTWEKIDLQKLALFFPQIKELSGKLAGDLRIAPATVPHPREPLAILATMQFTAGAWRTLPIKDARVAAYFGRSLQRGEGGWRVVLDDSPTDRSFIHLAGGTVDLWGRFGEHSRGSSSQAQLTFRDLELAQFIRALGDTKPEKSDKGAKSDKPENPDKPEMTGKIAGSILLLRAPSPTPTLQPAGLNQMFPSRFVSPVSPATAASSSASPLKKLLDPIYGEGRIDLTQANLSGFDPFAALYTAAHLFQDVKKPQGTGNVEFHLERGALTIEHMRYFNHGTEIRAVAKIGNLSEFPQNTVLATVTLTEHPLGTSKAFVFSDINTALTSIQESIGLSAIRVTGTLEKYHITPLALSELGAEMRTFVVGDAKGN